MPSTTGSFLHDQHPTYLLLTAGLLGALDAVGQMEREFPGLMAMIRRHEDPPPSTVAAAIIRQAGPQALSARP